MPQVRGNENTTRLCVCSVCSSEFVGGGLGLYCSDYCRLPTCQAPSCSNKTSARRVKYCSDECRNAFQKKKPGRPKGYVATNTNHAMVCSECGISYLGHFNSVRCEPCMWIVCKGLECNTKIRWAKKGSTFCSESCKEAGLFAVLSAGSLGVSRGLGNKQSPEHVAKRFASYHANSGGGWASKEELSLEPILSQYGFEHTGNAEAWFSWKDGSRHNPDFVHRANKIVFEYFGAYWHRADLGNEQSIIDAWAEIGYRCIILWSTDRLEFLANPDQFLDEGAIL